MPLVLREIGPDTNFSPPNSLQDDDNKVTEHERKIDLENPCEENYAEASQERNASYKENVSPLDCGARDECQRDEDTDCWFKLDDDSCPAVRDVSEDFFNASVPEEKEIPLAQLPDIPKPSVRPDERQEKHHPIVAVLQRVASSKVPDVSAMQRILHSEDLPASIREAYPDGLVSSVYDVMLRHRTHTEVQVHGAQLLQKTALNVPQATAEIGNGKGIQLLIHSMLLNKESMAIQSSSAAALAALCSTEQNRITAAKFYVVEAIMSATQTFRDERYLQGACMKLLTAIGLEPENMDVIVNTKSIRLPFRVLKRHGEDKILVRIACECAFQLLSGFDETEAEEVAQMNPIKLFLSVLFQHAEDERTQIAATECALVFCNVNSNCLATCIKGRAADLCVRNLKRFRGRDHAKLHLACMNMLCLFAEAGCEKIVVSAGALEGCLTSMIEMRRVFAIQLCVLRLLERIVEIGEGTYLQRIIKAGGVEILSSSLKAYISQEAFVERGVRVMRSLRG